jgi:hypothetical protein
MIKEFTKTSNLKLAKYIFRIAYRYTLIYAFALILYNNSVVCYVYKVVQAQHHHT